VTRGANSLLIECGHGVVKAFIPNSFLPFVDPKDYYDTQRNMEACEGQNKVPFLLETSAFASFKDLPLPGGTGRIKGIVSKTYNGRNLVLVLNDARDAWLSGGACED